MHDMNFAATYAEARARFLAAAVAAGARIDTHRHPLRGPAGEKLATDVARLGPGDARRLIVTISATHGVEGHCGSGIQTASFAAGIVGALPRDTAAVAIHAINPHGFAWSRRVTEDNVDLNRNFADFAKPLPVNRGYAELRDAVCPETWTAESRAAAKARLDAWREAHGPMAYQTAIQGGQYADPEGVFFGGHAPTWSNRTLRRLFAGFFAAGARHIAVIDYHTGLGPRGHGEIINPYRLEDVAFARAVEWLGKDDVMSPFDGTSLSAPLVGTNNVGMTEAAAGAAVTGVALEYGVRPLDETFDALRADNWLHVHGDLASAEARAIKAEMRRVFYGDASDWKTAVVERAFDVLKRLAAGLARS